MNKALVLAVLPMLSLAFAGCGDDGQSVTPTPDMAAVAPGTYSLEFGPISVAPGVEKTQCLTLRLGNAKAFHAGTIHNQLGPASHHLIVYRVNDTVEVTTPVDCQPFTDTLDPAKGSPLMITQKSDEVLQLPAGVGYTIDANQMVRLEVHYINPSTSTVTLTAKTSFTEVSEADFKQAAGFLFVGNPDISLPPRSMSTLGPSFFKLPTELADATFFAITGHEHQYGTNVLVSTATSDGSKATSVYDVPNWKWSESPTVFAPTPFTVPASGGFSFSCSWNNTSDNTVSFGESANNEMCFFWAYYYPDKGPRVCFHTDKLGGGIDVCCPGSQFCSAFGTK